MGESKCASASNCHTTINDNAKPRAARFIGSRSRIISASTSILSRRRGCLSKKFSTKPSRQSQTSCAHIRPTL